MKNSPPSVNPALESLSIYVKVPIGNLHTQKSCFPNIIFRTPKNDSFVALLKKPYFKTVYTSLRDKFMGNNMNDGLNRTEAWAWADIFINCFPGDRWWWFFVLKGSCQKFSRETRSPCFDLP